MVSQDVPDWTSQGVTATIIGNVTDYRAPIAVSSSGVNVIVSAVASKIIVVREVMLIANAAVNAKWQSHTTPTDLTGLAYFDAKGGYFASYYAGGHFQALSGESLDLNLSAAVAVGGWLVYGLI